MPEIPDVDRTGNLALLLSLLTPVPEDWARSDGKGRDGRAQDGVEPKECCEYRTLVTAWRKALRWTDGLDRALAVMLSAVASTKIVGDQLWVKVIGPAACGKSTLCEALSVCKEHVLAKSTIRGFHSGYKTDDGGKEDHSLVSLLPGKTLVTKDGDTLLQSPNLPQILAEGRDIYDGTSRTHYRNATSRDYNALRITWILCGTSSLRAIDSSELGERFLDCVIMEGIDDELEDEIDWRVANRADRDMAFEADGKPETHYAPELAEAMRLTGGYVLWLRANAAAALPAVANSPESKRRCVALAKFVAYMRARPSVRQEEVAEREFSTRLVSQLVRLSKCLALVLNRQSVDKEVMRRVARVALDTARGQTFDLAAALQGAGEDGLESRVLALHLGKSEEKVRGLLRFLRAIRGVESFTVEERGKSAKVKWRLTEKLQELYETATLAGVPEDA